MAAATDIALTVLTWGNTSRGDDGAGPILGRKIAGLGHPAIIVIEDFQLQIEHVMDLQDGVPVLFIDASVDVEADFALERLTPRNDHSVSTHSVSPGALLCLYEKTYGQVAPDAFLMHVPGEDFELGNAISRKTSACIDSAWAFLNALLAEPSEQWLALLEIASAERPANARRACAANLLSPDW